MRYDEYEAIVARILAQAGRRKLTKSESERLQLNLACMRMVCDTPYILDQECRDYDQGQGPSLLDEILPPGRLDSPPWPKVLSCEIGLGKGLEGACQNDHRSRKNQEVLDHQ